MKMFVTFALTLSMLEWTIVEPAWRERETRLLVASVNDSGGVGDAAGIPNAGFASNLKMGAVPFVVC